MKTLETLRSIPGSIIAPYCAVYPWMEKDYVVTKEHVAVWFFIFHTSFAVACAITFASIWIEGLTSAIKVVMGIAGVALIAAFVCRFAVVEREVSELRLRLDQDVTLPSA
ncbi:MAG: hypothetical protein ABSB15_00965 [Bryobacteraceae bacterium]